MAKSKQKCHLLKKLQWMDIRSLNSTQLPNLPTPSGESLWIKDYEDFWWNPICGQSGVGCIIFNLIFREQWHTQCNSEQSILHKAGHLLLQLNNLQNVLFLFYYMYTVYLSQGEIIILFHFMRRIIIIMFTSFVIFAYTVTTKFFYKINLI